VAGDLACEPHPVRRTLDQNSMCASALNLYVGDDLRPVLDVQAHPVTASAALPDTSEVATETRKINSTVTFDVEIETSATQDHITDDATQRHIGRPIEVHIANHVVDVVVRPRHQDLSPNMMDPMS